MEYWVQETLFDTTTYTVPGDPPAPRVTARAIPPPRRPNASRVTRDPAVAQSYAESARVASDFRSGLAHAYGRLSDEERAAIRARLGR